MEAQVVEALEGDGFALGRRADFVAAGKHILKKEGRRNQT
jgi:hypothetical protein